MSCFIPHLEGHQIAFQTRYSIRRTLESVNSTQVIKKRTLFLAHPVRLWVENVSALFLQFCDRLYWGPQIGYHAKMTHS